MRVRCLKDFTVMPFGSFVEGQEADFPKKQAAHLITVGLAEPAPESEPE
jgi:hypothetical protein